MVRVATNNTYHSIKRQRLKLSTEEMKSQYFMTFHLKKNTLCLSQVQKRTNVCRFYFRFICQFRLNSDCHSDNHKWSQQVII